MYALTAYPAGRLADRMSPAKLLAGGHRRAWSPRTSCSRSRPASPRSRAGIVLWGLHMGLTQGLLAAMVAQRRARGSRAVPRSASSTSLAGIAMLAASVIAGALWQFVGPAATFWTGAGLAAAALVLTRFAGTQTVRRGR